jgi:N-sulfoglucosamine sulfohydrolase
MNYSAFMLLMIVALTPCVVDADQPEARRPNVLLIVSEDNGPELGCYGDPYVQTPYLDQLAAEGVRFARAFVPYSVCSPSRACFYTGLYPHQNGQIGLATHKYAMYEEWPNLVSLLKGAGYRTGIIGKIHVNPESAFACDFRAYPGSNFSKRPVRGFADEAAGFINGSDDPFLLVVNYPDAHFPLIRQQYGLPEKPLDGKDVKPLPWVGADSARLREATANYYNCMSRLDTGVGMLLEELAKSGRQEDTLVIYMGDHGAQFSRGKTSVYEAGLRIPLIIRWPGHVQSGQVRQELVSTLDLLPTVLGAVGLEAPLGYQLPGRSLEPLLNGEDVEWRRHVFGFTTGSAPSLHFTQFSVRDERYKLVMSPVIDRRNECAQAYLFQFNAHFIAGTNGQEIAASSKVIREAYATYLNPPAVELYDLKKDPHEFVNLAHVPEYAAIQARLQATWDQWARDTRFPLAEASILERYTASEDRAKTLDYRGDRSFRWDYLDTFANYMREQVDQAPRDNSP